MRGRGAWFLWVFKERFGKVWNFFVFSKKLFGKTSGRFYGVLLGKVLHLTEVRDLGKPSKIFKTLNTNYGSVLKTCKDIGT